MSKTPDQSRLHVVLGAGPVGHAIATALFQQGASVRLVSRSGKVADVPVGMDVRATDLNRLDQALSAVEGAAVVYHCAAPAYQNWVKEFPALQDMIVAATAQAGARLVVLDNLYGYGVNGILSEHLPYLAPGPKGRVRADMATRLLADHQAGRIRATIARSADFIGPGVRMSCVGERFWPQLLKGKTISWFGNPDAMHSFTYVPDLARAMIHLGSEDAALGKAWHVPSLPVMSALELAQKAATLASSPEPRIAITSEIMMRVFGIFVPAAREMIEVGYQYNDQFEMDWRQYADTFGDKATDVEVALADTIKWWRRETGLTPRRSA